jgi:hypothetical protein
MYDAVLLICAVVGTVASILALLPVFGFDLRIRHRSDPSASVPPKTRREKRLWVAVALAALSVALSGASFYRLERPRIVEKIVEKPVDRVIEKDCPPPARQQPPEPVIKQQPKKKVAPPLTGQSQKPTPPSQSCPNGICIGGENSGDNTVNNFGPPTRTLDSQQIVDLAEVASRIPASQTVDVLTANTKEGDSYGTAIQEAMGKTAKPPQLKPGPATALAPFSKPAPTGTVVCVKQFSSPTMALAKEIGNVLVRNAVVRVMISPCSGVEDNEVRIIIAEP